MRVYIAGHRGLVGSALVRRFEGHRGIELITATRAELDLTDRVAVRRFLARTRPETVILAAGLTGGIQANLARPADLIYQNLMIETTVIHGTWEAGVPRLLNFGSSCMYPKHAPQPMRVEWLMTGAVEPTSEPYAVAKWAGVSLCAAFSRQHGVRFISAIPATVYGPADSFDPDRAHVLSALIRKLHDAKAHGRGTVTLWGSGAPIREFVYADDVAEACEVLLERYEETAPVNVGPGQGVAVRDLAALIAEVVGFQGDIRWDPSTPDGAPEKRLESSAVKALGWSPRVDLREGLARTYQWFLEHEVASAQKAVPCASS